VSKASDDLPEPDTPVITVSWPRGNETSTPFRLCWRAPQTSIAKGGDTSDASGEVSGA